jgi:small subunit ribosomal protein S20
MAHSKQALKRARQSVELREKNRAQRSAMKVQIKRTEAAIATGDKTAIEAALKLAQKQLDKAAKRRIIHPNAAARRKSTLASKASASVKAKKS